MANILPDKKINQLDIENIRVVKGLRDDMRGPDVSAMHPVE